jgi:hypothetical protein
MSTVKSKKLQVGVDSTESNNFTIYQPSTPDGTLRIGVGNADSPTEVARFDATGMISGGVVTAPTMERRYNSSAQIVSNATLTTLAFNTEVFANPSSIYDSGTKQFTPTKAGYYEVYFQAMNDNANVPYRMITNIYRNGSGDSRGYQSTTSSTEYFGVANSTSIIYCNGSTDYFDCRVYALEASSNNIEIFASSNSTYMFYKYLGDF